MSTNLESGSVLGDTYRLVQRIGKGGMGEVWSAEHTRLPKRFAVKVLHGAAAANEVTLARFRREAEIASRLGHGNIVEVLDFNTLDDGTPYMVMELLEGESLRDRATRGPLALGEVVRILRQVASALRAAHRQGVIHRDLKPDNIFLCQEELDGRQYERAKVLDFGISKIQGSQTVVTRDAEVLGTPIYMAPEQAAGRHTHVDGRTDEFALAAIAYELLSGQIAFGGETLVEVVNKIMNGTPAPLKTAVPTLPDHVFGAIDRALSKERDSRFPEITDFVEALAGDPAMMRTTAPERDIPTVPGPQSAPHAGFAATAASHDHLPAAAALGATLPSQDHLPVPAPAAASAGPAAGGATPGSGEGAAAPPPTAAGPVTRAGLQATGRRGRTIGIALGAAALIAIGALVATRVGGGTQQSREQQPAAGAATPGAGPQVGLEGVTSTAATSTAATSTAATDAPPEAPDARPAAAAGATDAGRSGENAEDPASAKNTEDSVSARRQRAPTRSAHRGRPLESVAGSSKRAAAPISTAAAAELTQAEAAIRAGKADDALHLARRALLQQRSPQAFSVMVRAYCIRRDLRMAKAMLQQLRGTARRRAVRWCSARGFDIGR